MNREKYKITEISRLSQQAYAESNKLPLVIVLDNVRSMNNVGSIFRTADAFRLEGLRLCGITACPPHPDIHKTALGAEDSVRWSYHSSTLEAVESLLAEGYKVYALEQARGSISLEQVTLQENERYAIVLGNEVKGVAQEVIDICTGCIEIPQFGTKHSLNVSVAAGMTIWQMVKSLLHKIT
ncbi:MAG: RNA methyltransferase [Porphyromonadaceae bacterium]|nr:RNA methyltransferase [Porphyromonadaceae bacterium]